MSQFSYTTAQGFAGIPGMLPFIPITLLRADNAARIVERLSVSALVDSGSTINVLPYDIGIQLGFVWKEEPVRQPVVGTLKGHPALGVAVFVKIPQLTPVRLWFAWSQISSHEFPIILGQTNFFDEFHVYFKKSEDTFELLPCVPPSK